MIDFERITGFQWDAGNARKTTAKHDVTQAEAEQVFLNEPLLVSADTKHSAMELRFHVLGHTHDNRWLHVTFTLREDSTLIRVISARDMHRKERTIYEKAP
jgi:uncharacterized DUF497 family protein